MFKKIFKNLVFSACFLGFFGLNCMEQETDPVRLYVSKRLDRSNFLISQINKTKNLKNKISILKEICDLVSDMHIKFYEYKNTSRICSYLIDFDQLRDNTKKLRSELERLSIIKIQNMLKFIKRHADTDIEKKAIIYINKQLRVLISDYEEHLEHLFEGTDLGQLYRLYCVVNNLFSLKYVD